MLQPFEQTFVDSKTKSFMIATLFMSNSYHGLDIKCRWREYIPFVGFPRNPPNYFDAGIAKSPFPVIAFVRLRSFIPNI